MEDRTIFFFLAVFEASIFLSNLHVFLIHANCSTLEWICFAPLRTLKTCNQTNIIWDAARIGLKFSHASILVKTWFVANFPELDYARFSILWLFCPALLWHVPALGEEKRKSETLIVWSSKCPIQNLDYRNASTPRAFISFDIHHILEPYVIIRAMLWSIHTGLFKRLITRISIAL